MAHIITQLQYSITMAAFADSVLTWASVVLGLGMVIFFHELGHFMVAKWCNVHVERFSIGIGPIVWSRQKGETEYALSLLPLGGYVKMLGQDDLDPNQMTSTEIAENPRAYSSKSVPQRMAIISAGVIMNIITGCLFFAISYRAGVMEPSPVIGSVVPASPAWLAGIEPGDQISEVNGTHVRSFREIQEAILLSMGDVRLRGRHRDGSDLNITITPDRETGVRQLGIHSAALPWVKSRLLNPEQIAIHGLPAKSASEPFQSGDRVVAIQSIPVSTFQDLQRETSRFAAETLIYTCERPDGPAVDGQEPPRKTIEITIPPGPVRSVGLWMKMGPIKAVKPGSLAEQAGLRPGDVIRTVDGLALGTELDPLALPEYFPAHAGQSVVLSVEREAAATGQQTVEITVVPDDSPAWTEGMAFPTTPTSIPAIGIAYQIPPVVAHVVPGSEADRSGRFQAGHQITQLSLEQRDEKNPILDTSEETRVKLELNKTESREPGGPADINWAYAFLNIQAHPERIIKIYANDGKQDYAVSLMDVEAEAGRSLWFRGIRGDAWVPMEKVFQAPTVASSLSEGVRKTKSTVISIYLMLRSIFLGELRADSMSGPVGILAIGKSVASEGLIPLLMFLGFLSINLAVLNFLPIPVLDGGHMVFLIYEAIVRKKPSPRVIGWAHTVGIFLIISLFVFVMYLDLFVHRLAS